MVSAGGRLRYDWTAVTFINGDVEYAEDHVWLVNLSVCGCGEYVRDLSSRLFFTEGLTNHVGPFLLHER
jgi:hypothetical protein